MTYSAFFLTALFLTLFTRALPAVTIHVPGDYPTIQAGINASVDGDTVLVADGTYTGEGNRDIDFTGKTIVVMSENGPGSCVIDCQNSGRGFYFHSGESSTSIVHGFTITNGDAWPDGGGIICSSSSPTISNNIITGNRVAMWGEVWYSARGGGIYYDESSSPTIINNVISGNSVLVDNWYKYWGLSSYSYGGGIYCGGPGGILSNNIISENRASADSWAGSAFAWWNLFQQ